MKKAFYALGSVVAIAVWVFALNQFDEELKPDLKAVLKRPLAWTDLEQKGIELRTSKHTICEGHGTASDTKSFFDDLIKTESYRMTGGPASIDFTCLAALAGNLPPFKYLDQIKAEISEHPEQGLTHLQQYIDYMANTSLKNETMIGRLMALEGLEASLTASKEWFASQPENLKSLQLGNARKLAETNLDEIFKSIRDSEVALSYSLLTHADLGLLIPDLRGTGSVTSETPWASASLKFFFQPNKTFNQLYDYWTECTEKACEAADKKFNAMTAINPVGQYILLTSAPRLTGPREKLKSRIEKVKTLLNEIQIAGETMSDRQVAAAAPTDETRAKRAKEREEETKKLKAKKAARKKAEEEAKKNK